MSMSGQNEVKNLEQSEKALENVALVFCKKAINSFNEAKKNYMPIVVSSQTFGIPGRPLLMHPTEKIRRSLSIIIDSLNKIKSEDEKIIVLAERVERDLRQFELIKVTDQLQFASKLEMSVITFSKSIDSELNKLLNYSERLLRNEQNYGKPDAYSIDLIKSIVPVLDADLKNLLEYIIKLFKMEKIAQSASDNYFKLMRK